MQGRYTSWLTENEAVVSTCKYWTLRRTEEYIKGATNRLAAYEDTGLTPEQFEVIDQLYLEKCREVNALKEQIKNLSEIKTIPAPKCKVGDKVYYIDHTGELRESEVKKVQITIEPDKTECVYTSKYLQFCDEDYERIVFPTPGEALGNVKPQQATLSINVRIIEGGVENGSM